MNKLQLYITKSMGGFKSMLNLNPDQEVQVAVTDVRDALRIPAYDPTEKSIFYLIKYTDRGRFVVILRTIPQGELDHLAAWIYIPNGMNITTEEITNVVLTTAQKVSNPSVSDEDLQELRIMFAHEYDYTPNPPAIVANRGTTYAVRYYGGNTGYNISDLIGDNLYQTSYLPYSGTVLIDAGLGISANDAPDLTDEPLDQMVPLLPPAPNNSGFAPYIFGRPFTKPYLVALFTEVEIIWRRSGFEDMRQVVKIEQEQQKPAADTSEAESMLKTISPKSFMITSLATRRPLNDRCIITVNAHRIDGPRQFTLAELANAEVTVACENYYTYSAHINLASSAQALIQLREKHKIYNFEIPTKSSNIGGIIKFEIQSKDPLDGSPIEGYELTEDIQEGATRTNHLIYKRQTIASGVKDKIIWGCIGLALGIIIMLLTRCGGTRTDDEPAAPVDESAVIVDAPLPDIIPAVNQADAGADAQAPADNTAPAAPAEPAADVSEAAAISYLDTNSKWTRSEMEAFPILQGLYDDMNNIERHKLVETWGPKLKESRTFQNIAYHAQLSYHKKARLRPGRNTYNAPNDETINVQTYLNTIDP